MAKKKLSKARVLIVDDREENLYLLRALLEGHGFQVDEARNGVEALAIARKTLPHLTVSDLLMPEMDGYTLLTTWKSDEHLKSIPFAVYTDTFSDPHAEKLARNMGADAFIIKPADSEDLLAELHDLLSDRGALTVADSFKNDATMEYKLYSEVLIRKLEEKAVQLDAANRVLVEREARLQTIFDTEPECVKLMAADGSVMEMNPAGLRMIEAEDLAQVARRSMYEIVGKAYRRPFRELTRKVFRGGSGILEFEIIGLRGTRRWLETHASPLRDLDGNVSALLGITRDVTGHKLAEAMVTCQTKVLEMIAVGAPLTDTLDTLLRLLEEFAPGMLCSILLLDGDGTSLRHCSAPSLPASFTDAIDGEEIGPNAGWCGTAAYRSEQVVVEDIATDPFWTDYRGIAEEHGLRACWSTPVYDDKQDLLGTFAIYYRQPGLPIETGRRCIDLATSLAAIAINRHRSQASLSESMARTQLLVESSNIGLWDWDLVTNEVYFSPEWKDQLGYSDGELTNQFAEWESRLHPDDAEATKAAMGEYREGKRSDYEVEFRLRHKDGSWRWIMTRADMVRDPEGHPVRMMGCHVDITGRKQAEDALRESEERFSTIFKAAPGSMMLFSMPEGKTVEVNDNFSIITGYTREEALGKSTAELGMWADAQARERMLALVKKNGTVSNFEADLRHRSGTIRSGLVSAHLLEIQGKNYLLGVFYDITELKRAEKERQVIFEIIQGAAVTPDLHEFLNLVHAVIGELIYAENCFVMLHDAATDTVDFEYWADKYDPPPPPKSLGTGFASYVMRTGKPLLLSRETTRNLEKKGKAELIGTDSASWMGVPLKTALRTIGVLAVQHYDIEGIYSERDLEFLASVGSQIALAIERKRADEALRDSEERYRDLVENALDIIYTHDLDGRFTSANKALEEVLGYATAEVPTKNIADIITPESRKPAMELMADLLAGKETSVSEFEVLARDGRRVTLEVNAKVVEQNGVAVGIQGIARDITERKNLEQQFLQSQKMEGIGRLAGGIAHDFNNMLTAINGYSDLALRQLATDVAARKYIGEVKKAAERSALLTSQLLAFSRRQVLRNEKIKVNDAITETSSLLKRLISEDIDLATSLNPDAGTIEADPGQLSQVLMNLAINARDAMPEGGKLTIETSNVFVDPEYADSHVGILPGAYVMISVSDTGTGMTPEVQEQIFEPFFTTKGPGKGTGLGLATVYGIVKQSGGSIFVYSETGLGTSFKIYFPRIMSGEEEVVLKKKTSVSLPWGTETILLAEDEDAVRSLSRQLLESCGYKVIEARDGIEALEILEAAAGEIDLLVTDVVMPRMGGRELAEKIGETMPDLPILFTSGYTGDAVIRHGVLGTTLNFVAKPFELDDVARKVREMLDEVRR